MTSNSYDTPELREALLEQDLVVLPVEALRLWALFLEGKFDLDTRNTSWTPEDLLMIMDLYAARKRWQEREEHRNAM